MEQSAEILFVCLSALIGIFIVLPALALVMYFIVKLFPVKVKPASAQSGTTPSDTAVYAAITTAYKTLYPGTKISNIVENK